MITDQFFSCVHVTSNTQFWNSLGILDRLGLLVYNATLLACTRYPPAYIPSFNAPTASPSG